MMNDLSDWVGCGGNMARGGGGGVDSWKTTTD